MSGDGVANAVRKLKREHHIPFRWMILDDGWQDTVDTDTTRLSDDNNYTNGEQWSRRLRSLHEDPKKFENLTLKETVEQLRDKEKLVDAFLVWHTLSGYWLGLDPRRDDIDYNSSSSSDLHDGQLPPSELYYPWFPRGIVDQDPSASQEPSVTRGIGIPNDAADFFHRYHTLYLSGHCGVDGVKVDAQCVTGILKKLANMGASNQQESSKGVCTPPSIFLHTALADSVRRNFAYKSLSAGSCTGTGENDKPVDAWHEGPRLAPIIHCMAHSPEIFFRLPSLYTDENDENRSMKPFFRAADDYYPDNPASHGAQIVSCAFNSLLFGHVAVPDWDMFTTTIKDKNIIRMHAIARCLSGGPIYLSDTSNNSTPNRAALDWVCCDDGTTFPCRQAALPILSSLFKDPLEDETPTMSPALVIWNTNGASSTSITSGILGIFALGGGGIGCWDCTELDYVATQGNSPSPPLDVQLSPSDIPLFEGKHYCETKFLAVCFFSNLAMVLASPFDKIELKLPLRHSESIVMYPIHELTHVEFFALGMRGKINGAGAVQRLEVLNGSSSVSMEVRGCGEFNVAARPLVDDETFSNNVRVRVNGIAVQHDLHRCNETCDEKKCATGNY